MLHNEPAEPSGASRQDPWKLRENHRSSYATHNQSRMRASLWLKVWSMGLSAPGRGSRVIDSAAIWAAASLYPVTMSAVVAALAELHARQREAHLSGDAAALTAMFADDYISVQAGEVSRPARDDSRARFERYFAQVTFLAWDDLSDPVIEVSGDGSLATVLVHKLVHLIYQDADGTRLEEITTFAWAETWRHAVGRWELAMMVSTRKDAGQQQADG